MWTMENRGRYDRRGLRYESDLTDEEWAEIELLIPPAKCGGNSNCSPGVITFLPILDHSTCSTVWQPRPKILDTVTAESILPAGCRYFLLLPN